MKEYIVKVDFITEGDEFVLPDIVSELIRCKDCKYRKDNGRCYEQEHIRIGLFVHDDEHCCWAEPKEKK